MARKLRLEYAGACYHVINRGNYRRPIFGTSQFDGVRPFAVREDERQARRLDDVLIQGLKSPNAEWPDPFGLAGITVNPRFLQLAALRVERAGH